MERRTVEPTSAVPLRWGLLTLVIPSPARPESSVTTRDGAGGAAGAGGGLGSIVREDAAPAGLTFPAASVAVAVTEYVPSARAALSRIEYAPPVAVPDPMRDPPTKRRTVDPASAVPLRWGRPTL